MRIIYNKEKGHEIVPVYRGLSPVGFKVIKIDTGEVVKKSDRLCVAEEFIDGIREETRTTLLDIMTQVNKYCEEE